MARRKKVDDGLCAFTHTLKLRITQEQARAVAQGFITEELAEDMRQALEDELVLRSHVFQAWYHDPPAPSDVQRWTGPDGTEMVEFDADDAHWAITAECHRAIIRMSAKLIGARYGALSRG
jgi:hypothetical protein